MSQLTPELVDQVRALSDDDKVRLVELAFGEVPLSPGEWADELAARWQRYKSGREPTYTLDEVMADLRTQAERRS